MNKMSLKEPKKASFIFSQSFKNHTIILNVWATLTLTNFWHTICSQYFWLRKKRDEQKTMYELQLQLERENQELFLEIETFVKD